MVHTAKNIDQFTVKSFIFVTFAVAVWNKIY